MATSKNDTRSGKVMDVTQPGKSAPPSTAKPIIVTNRPMLRRDPMVAVSNNATPDLEPASVPKPPVSRVAKTIKVTPLDSAETPAPAETLEVPADSTITPAEPTGTHPTEAAVALEVGQEALASLGEPAEDTKEPPVTDKPPEAAEASAEPTAETAIPAETPESPTPAADGTSNTSEASAPVDASQNDEAEQSPSSDVPKPAEDAAPAPESKAPASTETTAASQSEAEAAPATTDATGDSQLAPNKVHADEQQKLDDAAAARQAELDKIIDSKQYYLPITTGEKQRSTLRAALVLFLVIVLAVVWLDVVLDAGIVRIPGVQAPTHFFR